MAKFKRTCQECGHTAPYISRGENTRCKRCRSTGLDHGCEINEFNRFLLRVADGNPNGVIEWIGKLPSVTNVQWQELTTGNDIECLLDVTTKDYVTCDLLVLVVNRCATYRVEWVDPCDFEEVSDG